MNRRHIRTLIMVLMSLLLLAAPKGVGAQPGDPPRVTEDREAPEREVIVRPASEDALLAQVILAPEADTHIASERPTQNFGSSALFLGYNLTGDTFGAERIFLRFDVAEAVSDTVTINEAVLRLYLTFSSPIDDAPMPTRLQRVDAPWAENTLTWATEPEWGPAYVTEVVGTVEGWYEWEITELVREWVNGTHPNYGVELIGDETIQQRERAFYARETATAFYPQLVIDYTDVVDADPPDITVDPLPEYVDRDFTVSWDGTDPGPADIAHYDVQVRIDGGEWMDWRVGVDGTEAEYVGENGHFYEFRARGVDTAGNIEVFGDAEASTTVDTLPPVSTVDPLLPIINNTTFLVTWSGDDEGAGIATYDIVYRVNGGAWTPWLVDTTVTSAVFDVTADAFPDVDGVYEFEVRAIDEIGHQEAFDNVAEASTAVDTVEPFIVPVLRMPVILNAGGAAP